MFSPGPWVGLLGGSLLCFLAGGFLCGVGPFSRGSGSVFRPLPNAPLLISSLTPCWTPRKKLPLRESNRQPLPQPATRSTTAPVGRSARLQSVTQCGLRLGTRFSVTPRGTRFILLGRPLLGGRFLEGSRGLEAKCPGALLGPRF